MWVCLEFILIFFLVVLELMCKTFLLCIFKVKRVGATVLSIPSWLTERNIGIQWLWRTFSGLRYFPPLYHHSVLLMPQWICYSTSTVHICLSSICYIRIDNIWVNSTPTMFILSLTPFPPYFFVRLLYEGFVLLGCTHWTHPTSKGSNDKGRNS